MLKIKKKKKKLETSMNDLNYTSTATIPIKENIDSSPCKELPTEEEEEENRYIKVNIQNKINKILLPSLYFTAASTGDILGLNKLLDGWPALVNIADYHGRVYIE